MSTKHIVESSKDAMGRSASPAITAAPAEPDVTGSAHEQGAVAEANRKPASGAAPLEDKTKMPRKIRGIFSYINF